MSSVMAAVYTAISAILLFWHAAWHRLVGDASAWHTDWAWVLGIVFLVLTVRIALFPLVVRQIRSQRAVQRLQPRIAELRDRHRGDPQTMQAELLKLYRAEKIKPMASILPLLLQAPILFGLLHVLRHVRPSVTSEASRTLYGWTLTQFDSAVHAKLFGAPIVAGFTSGADQLSVLGASAVTVKLVAAALILIMTVTTYLTTRQMISKTGPATDPQGRLVQRMMLYGFPLSLLVSGVIFPIGVVLYWVVQNLFALGQQAWILRKYPPPAAAGQGGDTRAGKAGLASAAGSAGADGSGRSGVEAPRVGARPARSKRRRR
ncbi:membrane protein insertase YidC [Actinoplanes sp. NPDC024001]|uniref:membrane protein insertase YidC n=1 Tax=Actinoplanes sp. NPDC024001 TaxID=3154598 RepID=UPI0033D41E94